jgi:hypothetical protein
LLVNDEFARATAGSRSVDGRVVDKEIGKGARELEIL